MIRCWPAEFWTVYALLVVSGNEQRNKWQLNLSVQAM